MIEASAEVGIGALLVTFAHDVATWGNRFSVKLYETFPALKKLPRSRLAGSQLNYKYMFYALRFAGAVMLVGGTMLLGLVMLRWK